MSARTYSFEFFPPKSEPAAEKLRAARAELAAVRPAFFSVTFGAGGSTRDRTLETVLEIQAEGLAAAPHLSCIGSTRENIREILDTYKADARPWERMADWIERIGWPRFFEKTGLPFTKYMIDDWRGSRYNLNASAHVRF